MTSRAHLTAGSSGFAFTAAFRSLYCLTSSAVGGGESFWFRSASFEVGSSARLRSLSWRRSSSDGYTFQLPCTVAAGSVTSLLGGGGGGGGASVGASTVTSPPVHA